jgi:hypothetical protein
LILLAAYEFGTSVAQLRSATALPPREKFFSKVSNSGANEADYEHAKTVFAAFGCANVLAYCEVYCTTDVYLLAEAFLSFREEVIGYWGMDPAHYISLPQLAFDCMLRQTGVCIEHLPDIDMVLFLERGIRGGVSFIGQRHCEATCDDSSLGDDSDDAKRSLPPCPSPATASRKRKKCLSSSDRAPPAAKKRKRRKNTVKIMYGDANNLYGNGQSCSQPIGGYRWMEKEEYQNMDWTSFDEDAEDGYILEVDLEYPPELHLSHSSLPLAPHHMDIDESVLSDFSKECLLQTRGQTKHRSRKLVSTFLPREKYAIHAHNLALYLSLGMKLKKVHRVLTFRQSKFLKVYIDQCTAMRSASQSEFKKRLFKAFSNSNFGKFIEQTRNHLDCHIVRDKAGFEKWVGCPRFSNFKTLGDGFTAVFLKLPYVRMKQAWAIGFTILERSKGVVYNDYYNVIRPALGNRCSVLFTDTDSLCLRIVNDMSMDEVLDQLAPILDTSNYPTDHPRYDPSRKNKLGYWKDELAGQILREFVGLSSKTYAMKVGKSLTSQDLFSSSKCKGVGRGYRKTIPFADYKRCITNIGEHSVTQFAIRPADHVIRTVKMRRRCFSSFDDKRHVMCPM